MFSNNYVNDQWCCYLSVGLSCREVKCCRLLDMEFIIHAFYFIKLTKNLISFENATLL